VNAGDHQTELLKSPEILLSGSTVDQDSAPRTGDRN
jgi:hypothetical protein